MQSINLIPREHIQTERGRRRTAVSVAVLVAVIFTMFGFLKLLDKWVSRQEQANAFLESEARALESDKSNVAAQTAQLALLLQRRTAVEELNRDRRCTLVLARVAEATSDQMFLTRIKLFVTRPADEPAPAAGNGPPARIAAPITPKEPLKKEQRKTTLLIEGYATVTTDITGFIARFGNPDLFGQVLFKTAQAAQINNLPLTHFELECPIRTGPRNPNPTSVAQTAGGTR